MNKSIFLSFFLLGLICFREAAQLPSPLQESFFGHEAQSIHSASRCGSQSWGDTGVQDT